MYGVVGFLFIPVTPFLCSLSFLFVTHCNVAVLEIQLFVSLLFIMSSRSHPPCKGFAYSPEMDQCTFCGCVVVARPMGLSRHLVARNPDCQLEYSMEHNASCQQSSTGISHNTFNGQESDDIFIHTNNASSLSCFNPSLSSLSKDHVACCPHEEDISNKKPVDDDFTMLHDYFFDEHG